MARLSAADIKKHQAPFEATIPGLDGEVLMRRPSLRRLAYSGQLPMPLLAGAVTLYNAWVGKDLSKLATKEEGTQSTEAEQLLNYLVADCLVEPRCVPTAASLGADSPDTLIAAELDIEIREAIVITAINKAPDQAARKEEAAAAAEFPENRPGA